MQTKSTIKREPSGKVQRDSAKENRSREGNQEIRTYLGSFNFSYQLSIHFYLLSRLAIFTEACAPIEAC